jgi:hypothetical protein
MGKGKGKDKEGQYRSTFVCSGGWRQTSEKRGKKSVVYVTVPDKKKQNRNAWGGPVEKT